MRAIRDKRYKLIRCFRPDKSKAYYSAGGSKGPMFEYWVKNGYDKKNMPEYALFDLMFDPLERCNEANNPEYAGVFERLQAQLNIFMKETDDPLLYGPLPPSPGMMKRAGEDFKKAEKIKEDQ